jgi:hypothetical protein
MKAENVVDSRMRVLKMAMRICEGEGAESVISTYDALWSRISSGEALPLNGNAHADALVEQFFTDCVEMVGSDRVKVQHNTLFTAFKAWCEAKGHEPLGMRRFGEAVSDRVSKHKSTYVFYVGIRLKETPNA